MISKLKSICLSKTNIVAVSLSTFAYLKDLKELITSFASHLVLIGLTLFVLVSLLLVNLFMTKSANNENENAEKVENNTNQNISGFSNAQEIYLPPERGNSFLPKLLFSSILFIVLMVIGSLFYVKNMGVYYVVLKNNLTEKEAIYLKSKINNSAEFSNNGLTSRFIPIGKERFELILFNGYINESNANSDLEKVKSIAPEFSPYKVGPQDVANFYKKLRYLQNDIFH